MTKIDWTATQNTAHTNLMNCPVAEDGSSHAPGLTGCSQTVTGSHTTFLATYSLPVLLLPSPKDWEIKFSSRNIFIFSASFFSMLPANTAGKYY